MTTIIRFSFIVFIACLLAYSKAAVPINDELATFVRQVESSIADEPDEAIKTGYKTLVSEYATDTDRLEQDLVGIIHDTYSDSINAVANFIQFIKELRRQFEQQQH